MSKKDHTIILFNKKQVRRHWNEDKELWYFSVIDVIKILTDSISPQAYWRKLKERLKKEGNETVTNCHGLKMKAEDGKMRFTDIIDTENLLRLFNQSPPLRMNHLNFGWLRLAMIVLMSCRIRN